jgi:hypothetical protein
LFQNLGGSWKRHGGTTKTEGRFLHGQEGRGRFKALSLGRAAEWDVTYAKGNELWTYTIHVSAENIQEVVVTNEVQAPAQKRRGVILSIVAIIAQTAINVKLACNWRIPFSVHVFLKRPFTRIA